MSAFPSGIFPWTPRVDNIDIVWAADPNSLAGEVGAIESTLGINPQVMKSPLGGGQLTFASVDSRLDYLTTGQHIPACSLTSQQQLIRNNQGAGTNYGEFNVYSVNYDPFGFFNGSDVTVPVNGWYTISANQLWDWWSTGYNAIHLYTGTTWKTTAKWQWDFTGNTTTGYWQAGNGTGREGPTGLFWQGLLSAGTRVRIVSENGTSNTPATAYNMELSVLLVRSTPVAVTTFANQVPGHGGSPTGPAQVTQYPAPSGLKVTAQSDQTILVKWNLLTYPTPVPASYTIAVWQLNGVMAGDITVSTPDTTGGVSEATVSGLTPGWTYNVKVWANGGLIAPPGAQTSITMPS